jgi:hypothetical protein
MIAFVLVAMHINWDGPWQHVPSHCLAAIETGLIIQSIVELLSGASWEEEPEPEF